MKLEDTGIEGTVMDVKPLSLLMGNNGFIRGEQWDYERISYDYKIGSPERQVNYYIRIQGYAIKGDIDIGNAVVKLLTPILGKHYYPHGVEYDEEEFSASLIERAHDLVVRAKEDINKYQ